VLSFILTKKLGGKAAVRYNDFMVKIQRAGKEGAGEKVRSVLESIQAMERFRITPALPLPPADGWKFARVLPRDLFTDLVAADYYYLDEFLMTMTGLAITIVRAPSPLPTPPDD
jgi:hypothetical protein